VVALLTTVGYRRDTGTTLIVEHGTAAIRPDFEDRIHHATGGLVKIDRGGIAGQPAYPGMFEGQARGNFRFKATIESSRVRLRNEMAAFPGSVGMDRDHTPEGDYGSERYNQKLLRARVMLPADLAARLQFPILDWRQFVPDALEVHRLIDARIEHDLEGWERCRYVKYEYRLSVEERVWLDAAEHFARMDQSQREAVHAHVLSKPGLWRSRKMSPQEVWDAGKGELVTVPEHALPMLLGPAAARRGERCERNKLFIIQDRSLNPEPLHYDANALIRQGCVIPGEYYTVFLNPFAPARLVVCDAALRYLGTAHFWDRVGRLDHVEAAKRIAHAKRDEAPSLENLSRRGGKQLRRMAKMRENNAAALSGRPQPVAAAILQAADDAALLDGAPAQRPLLLPSPPLNPSRARPLKTDKAAGNDLDLL
jgi:hypothetical protein